MQAAEEATALSDRMWSFGHEPPASDSSGLDTDMGEWPPDPSAQASSESSTPSSWSDAFSDSGFESPSLTGDGAAAAAPPPVRGASAAVAVPVPRAAAAAGPSSGGIKRARHVYTAPEQYQVNTLEPEKAYMKLLHFESAQRPKHLNDGDGERFFKEPRKLKRETGSDLWKNTGKKRTQPIGRFKNAQTAAGAERSETSKAELRSFERCAQGNPSDGIGTIMVSREPLRIKRRASQAPDVFLPKEQWAHADEWTIRYDFDQHAGREPVPSAEDFPHKLFHVAAVPGLEDEAVLRAQQAAVPSAAAARPMHDPMRIRSADPSTAVLELHATGRQFVTFAEGEVVKGEISSGDTGVGFETSAGDFAEWYEAESPSEVPFLEGEVVGLFGAHISRATDGADACGIITRRFAVAGSMPQEKALWDTVAFTGRVPVRTRGVVAVGQTLVASGRNDGTAIAACASTQLPAHAVGQVEQAHAPGSELAEDIFLVPVRVFPVGCNSVLQAATAVAKAKTVAAAAQQAVEPVKPSDHSTPRSSDAMIHTMKDDVIDTFSETSIASGAKGRRPCIAKSVASALLLMLVSFVVAHQARVSDASKPVHIRRPESGSTRVSAECPPQQVSTNALGLCMSCQGKDAVVSFRKASGGDVVATCPAGFTGTLSRTCSGSGNWSAPHGQCSRLLCPKESVSLPGYVLQSSTAAPVDKLSHSVMFSSTAEGESAEVSCPGPAFTGKLVRRCMPNSTAWTAPVGNCTRHQCEATEYSFKSLTPRGQTMVTVRVPQTDYGISVQVPVCERFTGTGSCVDETGDGGWTAMECGSFGGWRHSVQDVEAGNYVSASSIEATGLSHSTQVAGSLYSSFVRGVSTALRSPPGASWALPSTGVFAAIAVTLAGGEQRHVFSTRFGPMDRSHPDTEAVFDTVAAAANTTLGGIFSRSVGRSAAAFARVACKELGYEAAPVVTNCQGLVQLLAALPHQTVNNTAMLSALCPEHRLEESECPSWFEVRDPPINDPDNTQLDWVRANAYTKEHAGVVARAADAESLPQWGHLRQFSSVGPVPESPSCDGTEDAIVRCFQHQMIIPQKTRQSWTRRCNRRMLVACSNPVPSESESEWQGGTWVVGDSSTTTTDNSPPSTLKHPKIFDDVRGPLDCRTGQLASDADIQHRVEELCWGTILGGGESQVQV